jgi:DNA-binding NtrC family response regulator
MGSILIVEDEHALGTALELATRRAGHQAAKVASGAAALKALTITLPSAVVLDIGLPDMSGLEVLQRLREKHPALPVLVITAHGTLDHAIRAQQLGATDYLTKPLDLRKFDSSLAALLASAPQPVSAPASNSPEVLTMVGGAAVMQPIFLGIARASSTRAPVLISGPSGSGKTLAARLIHEHSRSTGPLVTESSAAQGACTWLIENLDQRPASEQEQLAALLSQGEQEVRVMATLSTEPQLAMQQGSLRPELYYALSALHLALPPLQQRSGDIPGLAAFFLGMSGSTAAFTQPALQAMQTYAWPGNVRELRAAVSYAAEQARGGAIYLSHLPAHFMDAPVVRELPAAPGELDHAIARWVDAQLGSDPEGQPAYDHLMDQVEATLLQHLLTRFGNKPTHLANALRMNRATLRQKLRRLLPEQEDA